MSVVCRWCVGGVSVVCRWCVGSVSADASVGSDSLPLPKHSVRKIAARFLKTRQNACTAQTEG